MKHRLFRLPALLALVSAAACAVGAQEPEIKELYRVRVVNRSGGAVEVSADEGLNWSPLGTVTRPASAVALSGSILGTVPAGTVAAVGPEHLLLRTPGDRGFVKSLQVLAKGQPASAATIATDIPVRGPLFRYLAPPVGSQLLLEQGDQLRPLAMNYIPRVGDALILQVPLPPPGDPPTLTLENRANGEVVLATTGGIPQVVGRVKQPLKGIGRYAGTERAGAGAVLCWSPTTVLVSTAGTTRRLDPDGQPLEERGGFVIQPAEPKLQGATNPASQMLVEALPEAGVRPPVARFFGLPVPLSTGDPLDPKPTRVEVRIDNGDWQPMPDLRGVVPEEEMPRALQAAGAREAKTGITHLRFLYSTITERTFHRCLQLATTPAAEKPQRGEVRITANVMGEGVRYVQFFLDGTQANLTNLPPYVWTWDTTQVRNGEHLVEIRGLDDRGSAVTSVTTRVLVDN